MTHPCLTFTAAVVALALAACTQMADADAGAKAATADHVPPAQVTGKAENCINTSNIRNTGVHGDQTIDFEMNGGRIYRNTLPRRCYSLAFEERFAYETPTGRLCSTDTITVLHSDGSRGITCGLGEFLPIQIDKK